MWNSSVSEDGARYGSLSDQLEREPAWTQSSPQTPSPSRWWLVVRHSFLGCLTCCLDPTQGLFQAQCRRELLEGLGCVGSG